MISENCFGSKCQKVKTKLKEKQFLDEINFCNKSENRETGLNAKQ